MSELLSGAGSPCQACLNCMGCIPVFLPCAAINRTPADLHSAIAETLLREPNQTETDSSAAQKSVRNVAGKACSLVWRRDV